MIEVTVKDMGRSSPRALQAVIDLLTVMQEDAAEMDRRYEAGLVGTGQQEQRIAHEDRPDVGMLEAVMQAPQPPVVPKAAQLFKRKPIETPPPEPSGTLAQQMAVVLQEPAPFAPPAAPAAPLPTVPAAPQSGGAPVSPPPVIPVFTAPLPAPAPEVDVQGLPWDARIHSSSKQRNADGTWRQRRNLDPKVQTEVTAELRKLMALPAQMPAPPVAPPPMPVPPAPAPAPVVAPPLVPVPVAQAGSGVPTTYPDLMQALVAGSLAGTWTPARIIAVAQGLGLSGTPALAQRPDLIPQFWSALHAPAA